MNTKPGNERPEERLVELLTNTGIPDIYDVGLPIARAMAEGIEALRRIDREGRQVVGQEGHGALAMARIARTALQALDSLGDR